MYEYKCIEKNLSSSTNEKSTNNATNIEYLLNLYGNSGWKLVSQINSNINTYMFILEREKREILE